MKPGLQRTFPRWAWPALGLGGLTLWFLLIAWPLYQQLSAQQQQTEALQTRIEQGVAARASLSLLRSQVAQLQIEAGAFEQQVPPLERLPALVSQLGRIAQQHSISLQQLGRSVERDSSAGVATTRIAVVARGKLNQVYAFWRDLLAQGRYLNLDRPILQLAGEGRLEVRFQLLAYSLPK